jgi:hypothetical protein
VRLLALIALAGVAAAQETPPAEAPRPRPANGVPGVLATERPSGGPIIELPPEDGGKAAPPAPAESGMTTEEQAARLNQYSTLRQKAAAIINRTVIGGYGEFTFTKRQGEDSVFEARRFVAFLYAPIHERISLATEIEFEKGGSPLKLNGQETPGEVLLEFSVLDIKIFEWLVLRGGIVLVPFGRFNINHDSPTQELTDRPLALTYVVPSTWFDIGAGLVGRYKLGRGVELNHEVYVINGFDSMITPTGGYRAARGGLAQDNNDDKAVTGRVGLYYFGPVGKRTLQLDLGLSGYTGAYDRFGRRATLLGFDVGLRIAGFELLAEFARGFNQPGFNDDYLLSTRAPVPTDLYGFFVEARYRFMPNGLRKRLPNFLKQSLFTLILRYDIVDLDMVGNAAGSKMQRMTFGLNYRFIQAVAWKHEIQLDHPGAHNPFDNPKVGYVTSFAFLF